MNFSGLGQTCVILVVFSADLSFPTSTSFIYCGQCKEVKKDTKTRRCCLANEIN